MKILAPLTLALSTAATCNLACAQEPASAPSQFDTSKAYAGVGFSSNRIDTSSVGSTDGKATGTQIFAGYELDQRQGFDIAAELGLMQSGELYDGSGEDLDGIWVSAVATKDLPEIDKKLTAITRLGYGLTGDDGVFMGFGAQYRVHPQAVLRLEYLNKDLSQSYQMNAVFEF